MRPALVMALVVSSATGISALAPSLTVSGLRLGASALAGARVGLKKDSHKVLRGMSPRLPEPLHTESVSKLVMKMSGERGRRLFEAVGDRMWRLPYL